MEFPDITYLDKSGNEVTEMDDRDIKEELPEELWGLSEKVQNGTLTESEKMKLEGGLCMYIAPYCDQTWLNVWRFNESKESLLENRFIGSDGNEKFSRYKCQWGEYTIYLDEMTDGERYYGYTDLSRSIAKGIYISEKARAGIPEKNKRE